MNKKAKILLIIAVAPLIWLSCTKATVNFGEESLSDDPNILYIDTLAVSLATLQLDSFTTSGYGVFVVGVNNDDTFGGYDAKAYMQITIPENNPLSGCSDCVFDSLSFVSSFTGSYYGDTTRAFTLNIHQLAKKMDGVANGTGYNINSFPYDDLPIGSATFNNIKPSAKAAISVVLNETLGLNLYNMMKRGSDTITTASYFEDYMKGLVLTGKVDENRGTYYLSPQDSNTVMRLHYRHNGSSPSVAYIDFPTTSNSYTFNSFTYDRTYGLLSGFEKGKRIVKDIAATKNLSLLHQNGGIVPRVTFPSLFNLKELYPYIKVIKAELEITPALHTYGAKSIYQLPPYLSLYSTDENNSSSTALTLNGEIQYGNLVLDFLYNQQTKYTYDVTTFVNAVLTTGRYPEQALLLMVADNTQENRLILEGNKSVKLKLYVLGL